MIKGNIRYNVHLKKILYYTIRYIYVYIYIYIMCYIPQLKQVDNVVIDMARRM